MAQSRSKRAAKKVAISTPVRKPVSEVEAALRREIRHRRLAERVSQRQSEALAKTLELLSREPELSDFIRAMLRVITRQCGGLWTTFWVVDEETGQGRRQWFQWQDEATARRVEAFAEKHALLMRRLAQLYSELIHTEGASQIVPAEDSRVSPAIRRFYRKIGARGTLLVPLKVGRRLLGWISHQRGDTALSPEQKAFMESMAQQAALAYQLSRLSDAQHDAECAREEERIAREQEFELAAISRFLHVDARDPKDRLGAVLHGALENMMRMLRGRWASLWRTSDANGFVIPLWEGPPGVIVRVPAAQALNTAQICNESWRGRFDKWLSGSEMQLLRVGSPRHAALLRAIGAPRDADSVAQLAAVPLRFNDEPLGFMLVLTEEMPEKTSKRLVAAKALAMQSALALSLDEMSSVQRAAELAEERNRIARDLHDFLAQSFTGITMQVEAMRAECPGLPGAVQDRLEKIRTHAGLSAEELRRTLMLLRPTALDQCSFAQALVLLARETEARTGVRVRLRNDVDGLQLAPRVEQHLFAIVSEALQNALKHANPRKILISFEVLDQCLVMSVVNDGRRTAASVYKRADGQGYGLENIRHRAGEIGGKFSLRTRHQRTRLEVVAPVNGLFGAKV